MSKIAFKIYTRLHEILGSGELFLSFNSTNNTWQYRWYVKVGSISYCVYYFIDAHELEQHFFSKPRIEEQVQKIHARMRKQLDADFNERNKAPGPTGG